MSTGRVSGFRLLRRAVALMELPRHPDLAAASASSPVTDWRNSTRSIRAVHVDASGTCRATTRAVPCSTLKT